MTATRAYLAEVARRNALKPFHGFLPHEDSNLAPIVAHFPRWNLTEADGLWCAAFVYHCCMEAGFHFPYSPEECESCSLAGCGGWEEFAMKHSRIRYHRGDDFLPQPGDIVLYDRVFCDAEHDHIGIVLEADESHLLCAEGNSPLGNISGIISRSRDEHIRGYIRIPDCFCY
ncbi:MAG: CHAP domain-containing protein [Clostridia bacterium]|nr:CHAP domain-containing protein [Clostridia bacterium]